MYLVHISLDLICLSVFPPSELDEYGLHGELALPLSQTWQLCRVDLALSACAVDAAAAQLYLSVLRVDAGQVDLGRELNLRRRVGVVWAAVDRDAVDAVLVDTLCTSSIRNMAHGGHQRIHGVGRGWCHSSPTSTDRLRCQDHMNKPLSMLSNALSTAM